jgi:hypothetical protein
MQQFKDGVQFIKKSKKYKLGNFILHPIQILIKLFTKLFSS